ncbi:restriction endonuclease subunit S [uncultured Duncaniella sp.]|uniref:restriction endonuclease subunit S n=1 Tax=uncultured Duncaniella sp. TaxID=2768039 RepID=UPI0025A57678|nr:restriction endonuclease subunit S [uncultured Duncaniella sp.]
MSASSTSVPIINKSQFSQIEISLPKLSEQEVIAQCLSVIDRKIALNREINRNLSLAA